MTVPEHSSALSRCGDQGRCSAGRRGPGPPPTQTHPGRAQRLRLRGGGVPVWVATRVPSRRWRRRRGSALLQRPEPLPTFGDPLYAALAVQTHGASRYPRILTWGARGARLAAALLGGGRGWARAGDAGLPGAARPGSAGSGPAAAESAPRRCGRARASRREGALSGAATGLAF